MTYFSVASRCPYTILNVSLDGRPRIASIQATIVSPYAHRRAGRASPTIVALWTAVVGQAPQGSALWAAAVILLILSYVAFVPDDCLPSTQGFGDNICVRNRWSIRIAVRVTIGSAGRFTVLSCRLSSHLDVQRCRWQWYLILVELFLGQRALCASHCKPGIKRDILSGRAQLCYISVAARIHRELIGGAEEGKQADAQAKGMLHKGLVARMCVVVQRTLWVPKPPLARHLLVSVLVLCLWGLCIRQRRVGNPQHKGQCLVGEGEAVSQSTFRAT